MILTPVNHLINKNIKIFPILNKYQLLKTARLKPLSRYHKLCLSVIIPHGLTDSIIYPREIYALNYLSSCLFFSFYSINLKFLFFYLYSIYHIRNDISGPLVIRLLYSTGIHISWCFFPEWSLTYLACIHTVLHYYTIRRRFSKIGVITFISYSIITYILMSYDCTYNFIKEHTKNGLWIPIIIGHILNIN